MHKSLKAWEYNARTFEITYIFMWFFFFVYTYASHIIINFKINIFEICITRCARSLIFFYHFFNLFFYFLYSMQQKSLFNSPVLHKNEWIQVYIYITIYIVYTDYINTGMQSVSKSIFINNFNYIPTFCWIIINDQHLLKVVSEPYIIYTFS